MNNNGAHTPALIKQSAARGCASALVAILCVLPAAASACEQFTIGLNKFDLALQYIGRASGGNGSPAVIKVTRAMARKAITDAAHAGVSYFRIAASGFTPDDLELWTADPAEYWKSLDQMMADLRAADICVIPVLAWNPVQFPAIAGERLSDMLDDPNSASWQLLERYVRDFVTR